MQSARRSNIDPSIAFTGTMLIRSTVRKIRASIARTCAAKTAGCSEAPPMIVGIGIDLAEVERYRFDETRLRWFARRVYSDEEMAYALRKRHWAERLAGFFAAKEATRKAFGFAIPWREVCVTHERSGRPAIELRGSAAHLAQGLAAIHLTITHTAQTAAAVVILER